eukprot:Protomagalhaensia_sp_Gyna_25__2942@NODE_2728_length_923_cov_20_338235_g2275_i0_p1_GENE_NODE_2728_length_923_cov_20_338235_g2275_i0NODE_2728_length_923_cov_20_338235_g2275_i0_p1_ORF_typecomplete_len180_score21_28_NODE_2728_length_923_cov_20_338235_g2275_i046585
MITRRRAALLRSDDYSNQENYAPTLALFPESDHDTLAVKATKRRKPGSSQKPAKESEVKQRTLPQVLLFRLSISLGVLMILLWPLLLYAARNASAPIPGSDCFSEHLERSTVLDDTTDMAVLLDESSGMVLGENINVEGAECVIDPCIMNLGTLLKVKEPWMEDDVTGILEVEYKGEIQ